MKCALIMAGGKGTRFWPVSTEEKPKQFLNLLGERTMIQMTIDRLKGYIELEKIFICTSQVYIDLIKEQVPEIPERNIIVEPIGMNTAPCVALSSILINRYYPNASIFVLPSDHLVSKRDDFINSLEEAYLYLRENNESIITFGINPNRPETGYGYIEIDRNDSSRIKRTIKFVEKPNYEKALEYLVSGNYLWNSGIFAFKAKYIIELVKKHLPNTYEALKSLEDCEAKDIQKIINANYKNTDSISVDYGIMERINTIFVIKCDFGWDDVGSWNSLERYAEKDENGNVFIADGITYNSSNNIILSRKPIVVNGVKNIIVVETEEYIMISSKSKEQEIKKAKEELDKLKYMEDKKWE